MGYSCPVCGDPQADGVHLANHLAITAMTRGGDHEQYLDEHVPDWQELGEEGLAAELAEAADETEYPQVFEDTTPDHSHDHDHSGDRTAQDSIPFETELPDGDDEEATEIVEEAMELTRERRNNTGESEPQSESDEPETE